MTSLRNRLIAILLSAALLLCLCACTSLLPPKATGEPSAPPAESNQPEATPDVTPAATPTPTPEQTPEPTPEPENWEEQYMTFLSDNYDAIADCYPQGMVGIGFIDLDVDGYPEMLLFDQGASVSMGVQFFDIAEGYVTCVSASVIDIGEAFGGDHYTKTYVNANFFEDFRMMEDENGERFFYVESLNGNEEFSYSEIIRFGNDGTALTLESVLYKFEDYDIDSGELRSVRYQVEGKNSDEKAYAERFAEFFETRETGYAAAGAFVWNDKNYTMTYEGFMAMAEKAIEVYVPVDPDEIY